MIRNTHMPIISLGQLRALQPEPHTPSAPTQCAVPVDISPQLMSKKIPTKKEGPTNCFGPSNYQNTSEIAIGIQQI